MLRRNGEKVETIGKRLEGIKSTHFGSRKSGLSSFMDQEIYRQNVANMGARMGDGSLWFQALELDNDGRTRKAAKNVHANFGGRDYFSADGDFKINDEFYIKKNAELELEHEKAVDEVMKYILISNNICQSVVKPWQWEEIVKRNLTPSQFKKVNPRSDKFWEMMTTLRDEIISQDLPIFDQLTSEKQLNEEVMGDAGSAGNVSGVATK